MVNGQTEQKNRQILIMVVGQTEQTNKQTNRQSLMMDVGQTAAAQVALTTLALSINHRWELLTAGCQLEIGRSCYSQKPEKRAMRMKFFRKKAILGIRIRPDELKKGVTMRVAGVGKAVTA